MNVQLDRRTNSAQRSWRLRPVCMAIVAMGLTPSLQALPTGPKVVAGQATVNTGAPGQMQIHQGSDKAIIDWRNFSIGSGEVVRIDQPRVQSVLLNRVLGLDPSVILGRLQSNGRVFLSNPRGIVFGKDSQVDAGGFVATTLGMSNSSFLSGRYELAATGTPGSLTADGEISAPGGTIALVSPVLSVGGELHGQRVGLASASNVVVDVEGDGLIFFNARNDGLNARLDMLGHIQADGGTAELRAQARAGFADTVLNMEGVVQARSIGQREGRAVIDGGNAGVTRVSGQVDASGRNAGETGGSITVLGERVGLFDHALLDASGDVGGGSVQFGGGFKGQGTAHNAQVAYVAPTAALHADALTSGHGGQVVVWSDRFTRFEGDVSARGGARGGDGGNAEVSGKERLDYLGWTDLSASHGKKGQLLLDPKNLIIGDTADINGDGTPGDDLDDNTLTFDENKLATSKITAASVVDQLKVADVTLEAWQDITVSKAINAGNISKDSSLFMTAGRNILVNASITTKGGDIVLEANHKFSDGSGGKGGTITLGKNVALSTRGKSATTGDISLQGSGLVFGTGTSLNSGDNTTLVSTGAAALQVPTLTSGGTLDITAGGNVGQTGIFTVTGLTTLVADTNDVSFTLNNAGNDLGKVRVEDADGGSITTATVTDKNALVIGGRAGTLTASAGTTLDLAVGTYTTLNATAKGNITDSGTQTVSGTATLTANTNAVTAVLDMATNNFGTVALASTGGGSFTTATLVDAGAMTVTGNAGTLNATTGGALNFGAGTYTTVNATAKGNITDSGVVTVSGITTLTADTNAVTATLNSADNFGTVALATTGGGSFTSAAITDSGALTIGGDAGALSVTAGGAVSLSGGDYTTLSVNSKGNIGDSGALTVSGTTTLTANTNDVVVTLNVGTNNFGTVALANTAGGSFTTATLVDANAMTVGGAAGTLSATAGGALTLAAGSYTTLNARAKGNIGDSGALTVSGTATLTADTNAITTTLNTPANNFGTVTLASTAGGSFTSATLVDSGAMAVGGDAGTLTATAGGVLTLAGGDYTSVDVTGTGGIAQTGAITTSAAGSTFTVGNGASINLATSANSLAGSANGGDNFVNAKDLQLRDTGDIELGATTLTGKLVLVSDGGNITQSGAFEVGADGSSFTTSANNKNIVLDDVGNVFNGKTVSFNTATNGDVTVKGDALVFARSTIGGTISAEALTGDIGQTATANNALTTDAAGSTFTVSAGHSIDLSKQANSLAGLPTQADTFATDTSLKLRNVGDIEIGATTLSGALVLVSDTGGITQTGAISVGADGSSFTTSGNNQNIVLDDVGNLFNGHTVSVITGTSGDATITADALAFAKSTVGGKLLATALTGGITQTATANNALTTGEAGSVYTVSAGQSIDLSRQANSLAGLPTHADTFDTDTSLKLRNVGAISIAATTLTGALVLTSDTGAITQSGAIAVGADGSSFTTSGANQAITLNDAGNVFNGHTVSVNTASGNVSIQADALDFAVSDVGGKLTATSLAGAIGQSGALTLGADGSSFTAANNQDIVLTNAGNLFQGKTVSLNTTGTGNASVTAESLKFAASDIAGTLTATTLTGGISQTGVIKTGTAGSTFTVVAGQSIDLSTSANELAGAAGAGDSFVGATDLQLRGKGDILLAATTLAGKLVLISDEGVIGQSGAISVGADGSSFTTSGAGKGIDLSTAVNQFNGHTVAFNTDSGDVAVSADAIKFAASGIGGALTASSLGSITQSGALSVSGLTTLLADTNAIGITLNNAANNFGTVALASTGGGSITTATLVDVGALTVGGDAGTLSATAGGALALAGGSYTTLNANAKGNITDTGALTVSGTTTLTANTNAVTAALNTATNDFGTVTLAAAGGGSFTTATLVDGGALSVGGDAGTLSVTTGGTLNLAGGSYTTLNADVQGNVTDTGAVLVSGTTTLTANTNAVTAALNTATNDFGTVTLATTGGGSFTSAAVADADGLTVGGNAGTLSVTSGGAVVLAGGDYTTLNVNTKGNLSDIGALTVSGTTTLTANTNAITAALNTATNDLGIVTLAAAGGGSFTSATLVDSGALIVGGNAGILSVTTGDALTLAGGTYTTLNANTKGDVADTGAVTVSGTATLTANTNAITAALNTATNNFGTVTFVATGGGSFTSATLVDSGAMTVGGNAGSLSASAGGALTLAGGTYGALTATGTSIGQAGALQVSGLTRVNSGAGDTTLGNAANNFDTVAVTAGRNVTLADANGLDIATSTVSNQLALNTSGTVNFTGVLSGAGDLALQGTGTTVITTAQAYTGDTRINAGTLLLDGAAARAGNGGTIVVGAAGELQLDNAVAVHNPVSVQGGVISNTQGTALMDGAMTLVDTVTFDVAGAAGGLTVNGNISDGGAGKGLEKNGTGWLTLGGNNHYSGDTNINFGTLVANGPNALPEESDVNVADGASLKLGGNQHLGGLKGDGTIDLSNATLTVGGNNKSTDFSGSIVGTGILIKKGTGTLTLSGTNTFDGSTQINGGGLRLASGTALDDGNAVSVGGGAFLTVATSETIGSLAGAGSVNLDTRLRLGGNGLSTEFSGAMHGVGGYDKIGNGVFTVSGINDYSGGTHLIDGTIATASASALGTGAVSIDAGATLDVQEALTAGSLTGAGHVALDGANLTTGGSNATTTFSGVISGSGGLHKAGSGTLTLAGANTFTGPAVVDKGTLRLSGGAALSDSADVTVVSGAKLQLASDETIDGLAGAGAVLLDAHRLSTGARNASSVFSGVISGSGGLTKLGAGTLTLAGTNTYSGSTVIDAGVVQIGQGGASGSLGSGAVTNGGTLVLNRSDAATLNNAIVGSGELRVARGQWTLGSAGNSYTGDTIVAGGELRTSGAERLPDASNVRVASGATLLLAGNETVASIKADGAVTVRGNVTTTGDQTYGGVLTVDSSGGVTFAGADIEAQNAGNDWGGQPISVNADTARLASTQDMTLGNVHLANGGQIEATRLSLQGAVELAGGTLDLIASATPDPTKATPSDTARVAGSGKQLAIAEETISQQDGSAITVASGAQLNITASGGGSVNLAQDANRFDGGLSVLSGAAFDTAWATNVSGNYSIQSQVLVSGSTVNISGQGIEADMIHVRADRLATTGDSVLAARMPYDNVLLGTSLSAPGLVLELAPGAFNQSFPFGHGGDEIKISVGSIDIGGRTSGPNAGFLEILPKDGAHGSTAVFLAGPDEGSGGVGYTFFHEGSDKQDQIPVIYNGLLPETPQLSGALSSVSAVSEGARKDRFEETVRTENVTIRLRSGVIAEVGPGRPATVGTEGVKSPSSCTPASNQDLNCAP